MALNPDGITIQQLADMLRKYWPDQYNNMADDDLVNMFRNNRPDMLDWDNIINEPSFWERTVAETRKELKN